MLKIEFEKYLMKQGYSIITSSANPSTVYNCIKSIDKIIEQENLCSWEELAKDISNYVAQYAIGDIK